MFGVLSSLSQVPHQNSTNFSISCISFLCAFFLSKFLKNPFYSPWKFLASFSIFLHILPNLSFCTSICPTSAPLHFQVVISCIFFSQNSLFLNDLVFLLVDFLYFSESPCLFSLRSDVILWYPPFVLFFCLSIWSPSTNLSSWKLVALPKAYTLSHISGMVLTSFYFLSIDCQT